MLILASLHDTFPQPHSVKTVWVTCRHYEDAAALRREVILASPGDLPISAEYMDRNSMDLVDSAGRALVLGIRTLPHFRYRT